MKQINNILACIILMTSTSAISGTPQLDFVARVADRINYAEQHQQAVWPGFHPASTPTVIQFNYEKSNPMRRSAFAFNFQPGKLSWEKISTANTPIYFLADSQNLNIEDSDTFMLIDGQDSYVDIRPENFLKIENLYPSVISGRAEHYLKHESLIDPVKAKYLSIHYDGFNNPALVKLFYLEDAALTLAQQADTERAEEALRDAVAIHQYRNQLTDESSREFENGNEIMEGLPIYIGWNSHQLNEDDYRKMTQRSGCSPLNSLQGPFGVIECVGRGFAVYSSSVYGHALDKKSNKQFWKQNVEKQFESPWHQLAYNYYKFSDDQAKMMTEAAMQKSAYHYDRIVKVIDHAMGSYVKSLDIAKIKYKNTTGIEFHLPYLFGYLTLQVNDASNGEAIENSYLTDLHTYLLENINIEATKIQFKQLPFMSMNEVTKGFDMDEDSSYTSFKISDDAKLVIDNKIITARRFVDNKMIKSMRKLEIFDQYTHMVLYNGKMFKLDASEGVIKLKNYDFSISSNVKVMPFNQWLHKNINHETGLLTSKAKQKS